MNKDSKAITQTIFEHGEIKRVSDYVNRGRRFESLSSEQLELKWVEAYKAMAREPKDANLRANSTDLDVEMKLRGIEPPFDKVEAERQLVVRAAKEVLRDKEAMERVKKHVEAEIMEILISPTGLMN